MVGAAYADETSRRASRDGARRGRADGAARPAYALARDLGEPLLFKGRDFALTDIELVTEPDRRKRLSEVVAAYTARLAG